jgi:hypothetical protein
MRRRIHGLGATVSNHCKDVPDGVFLVRVVRAQYRRQQQKSFYVLQLTVLEPPELAGRSVSGRLYCTAKALWKLGWFLRDFLYDLDLLSSEEVDEKSLSGLAGVVKISHTIVNGRSFPNFDGFAPASQWPALSSSAAGSSGAKSGSEVA